MDITVRAFLDLLKAGIRRIPPEESLFDSGVDWDGIYRMASSQAVVPWIVDGVEMLPERLKPGIEIIEPFLADTMTAELNNARMDRFAAGAFSRLEKSGIKAVMVKGQGLASLYPDPSHRQSGDLDILLLPEDYEKARELFLPLCTGSEPENREIFHLGMHFGAMEMELHGTVSTLMSPSLDKSLNRMLREMMEKGEFPVVTVGGRGIPVPSVRFNVLYVFTHFLHHYWSSGVGLRQIADLSMFFSAHREVIDLKQLETDLDVLGLKRLFKAFGCFAVEMLGCPPEDVPLYDHRYSGRAGKILSYILESGNFGQNMDRPEKQGKNYISRKWHSFIQLVVKDRLKHFTTFPADSLRIFAGAFRYGLKRLSKGE